MTALPTILVRLTWPFLVEIITLLVVMRLFSPRYSIALSSRLGIIIVSYVPFVIAAVIGMMLAVDFSEGFLPMGALIASFLCQFAILFWYLRNHYGNAVAAKMVGSYAIIATLVGIIL